MRQFTIMIKPASGFCNMRCRYCFYRNVSGLRKTPSYGIMEEDIMQKMLDHIFCDLQKGDHVTFAFQGGEPLMAGMGYYKAFTEAVFKRSRGIHVDYTMQTNGTLLSEEWGTFLKKYGFLVGLSIDGSSEVHDANRVYEDGTGTWRRVMEGKDLLEQYGIDYNILAVLTEELAAAPEKLWEFVLENGISYLQLIPCLAELGERAGSGSSLTPGSFAKFYCRFYDLWKRSYEEGEVISVKLFDDILNLLVCRVCTACGMTGQCSPQIVVEADGSAYPCDFYVLDKYRLGNLTRQTLIELLSSERMRNFLARHKECPALCAGCPYWNMCGGGCERMRKEMFVTADGMSCGYRTFLDHKLPELEDIARQLLPSRM